MRKKTLIVTYYWPPAGGPGVQRWLKFVKYLPDFNVEPIVYTPENPSYPILDSTLQNDVSSNVTILKQPIKEPYKFADWLSKKKSKTISKGIISEDNNQNLIEKMLLFVRGNFFIPDARINWVKPSINFLQNYIERHGIEHIITTGPPHSTHLIGLGLKERCNITWIADFRDPWTTIGYHKQLKLTTRSKKKHAILEKKVLNQADQVIVTSNVTKQEFELKTQKPITVITNGYDMQNVEKPSLDTKFSLAHIGSLLSRRNPEVLWQVLKELVEERVDFANDFELNLVGFVSDDVMNSINTYCLSNHTNKVGYISHNESIIFQKISQLLVLIEIDDDDTKCIIPGKLFEYMVSSRPIIALGPKGSDVERILIETNTGNYFYYDAYESLKNLILKHYLSYKDGTLEAQGIGLQKYSRKALTKTLAELI